MTWIMLNGETLDNLGTSEKIKRSYLRMNGNIPFTPVTFPDSERFAVVRHINNFHVK